jgi:hypothetical protein
MTVVTFDVWLQAEQLEKAMPTSCKIFLTHRPGTTP